MEAMARGLVAGISDEERVRYHWWWRKYRVLRYAAPLAYLTAFAGFVLTIWRGLLDCPRCGKVFIASSRSECRNCGLSLAEISAAGKLGIQ